VSKLTLRYVGIKKSYTEWKSKSFAIWVDSHGEEYLSHYNNTFSILNPSKGQEFTIVFKYIQNPNIIYFPTEFIGINNNKHYVYDTRQTKLVKKGEEIDKKTNNILPREYLKNILFNGLYYGSVKFGNNGGSRYHTFKVMEETNFRYLYINKNNNGLKLLCDSDFKDEFKILFNRDLYIHYTQFRNYQNTDNWRIAIGEFPLIITNITQKISVIYDLNNQTYGITDMIDDNLFDFYKNKFKSWNLKN
jgi:hypothetical protein